MLDRFEVRQCQLIITQLPGRVDDLVTEQVVPTVPIVTPEGGTIETRLPVTV